MIIYTVLYFINLSFSFMNLNKKIKKNKIIFTIFIYTSIFLGFNYLNGIDWWFYQRNYYKDLNFNLSQVKGYEYLYVFLANIFKRLNFSYEVYQYIVLSACLYILYQFINKNSKYSIICICLLFGESILFNYLEPLFRQILALTFFLIGIRYIGNKKYYLYLLISIFFHTSAIVLLLIPFIKKIKKFNFKKGCSIFLILLVVQPLLYIIIIFFRNIKFMSHYAKYVGTDYLQPGNAFRILLVIVLMIPLYFLDKNFYKNKKKYKVKKKYKFHYKMAWIYIYIKLLLIMYPIFYRFLFYFDIFYYLNLSYLFYFIKNKINKRIILIILLFLNFFLMNKKLDEYKIRDRKRFFPYTNYLIYKIQNKVFKNHLLKIRFRFN